MDKSKRDRDEARVATTANLVSSGPSCWQSGNVISSRAPHLRRGVELQLVKRRPHDPADMLPRQDQHDDESYDGQHQRRKAPEMPASSRLSGRANATSPISAATTMTASTLARCQ